MKNFSLIKEPELNPKLYNSLAIMQSMGAELKKELTSFSKKDLSCYEEVLGIIFKYENINSFNNYLEVHTDAQGKLNLFSEIENAFLKINLMYFKFMSNANNSFKIRDLAYKLPNDQKINLLSYLKYIKKHTNIKEKMITLKVQKETRKLAKIWRNINTKNKKYVHFNEQEFATAFPKHNLFSYPQSEKEAKKLKLDGIVVYTHDIYFDDMLTNCALRNKREELWKMKFDNVDYSVFNNHVDYINKLNYQLSRLKKHKNFSEKLQKEQNEPSPEEINHFLTTGLKTLKPNLKSFRASINSLARRYGIEEMKPWDKSYIFQIHSQISKRNDPSFTNCFPYRQTIVKAVKLYADWFGMEVLKYSIPKNNKKGIPNPQKMFWRFYLKSKGKICYLDINPYANENNTVGFHDYCSEISTSFNMGSGYTHKHTIICSSLNPQTTCYTLDELSNLCHELGHAFHNFSLESELSIWDTRDQQTSTIEVPSQLMEMIAQNPWVKSHLSKNIKDKPKVSQKEMKKVLYQCKNKVYDEAMEILNALVDFRLNAQRNIKSVELRQSLLKEYNLDYGDEHEVYYPWNMTYGYNGQIYSYLWSLGLVNFMTKEYFMHHPKSKNFKNAMLQYKEKILANTGHYPFKQAWSELFYMPMEKAVIKGLKIKNRLIFNGACYL